MSRATNFITHPALCCPLDQLPLHLHDNSLRCDHGHNFDIARQGYVNLLSAQDKRSKDPGDSKAMVAARREFLNAGYYQPLAARLCQKLEAILYGNLPHGNSRHGNSPHDHSLPDEKPLLVDAGCGEGYYLQQLAKHLTSHRKPVPALVGFDISKWAAQAAARTQAATWLVASNRQIPLADHSTDLVLSLFGFPAHDSFQRILKPGGQLVLVEAGPHHLIELRQVIYPRIKESKPREVHEATQAGFVQIAREELQFNPPTLDSAAIGQLLQMTPHLFRASSEGKKRAAALTQLQLTVDVVIHVFQLL